MLFLVQPLLTHAPGMQTTTQRRLSALAWAGGLALFGYGALVLLTPQFGRIVGYANQQPPLRIIQPPDVSSSSQVEHIRQLAALHLDCRPEIRQFYWPQPSAIEEHPGCWLVTFTRKIPIYRWLGFEEVVPPVDQVMFLTIEKQDETTRFGRWCP